eukprot:1772894-Amphidinium_carterae.1
MAFQTRTYCVTHVLHSCNQNQPTPLKPKPRPPKDDQPAAHTTNSAAKHFVCSCHVLFGNIRASKLSSRQKHHRGRHYPNEQHQNASSTCRGY